MLQCHFQGRAPTEEKSSASLVVLLLPSRAGFRCLNLVPGRCLKVVKISAYDEENHVANLQQVPTSQNGSLQQGEGGTWGRNLFLERAYSEFAPISCSITIWLPSALQDSAAGTCWCAPQRPPSPRWPTVQGLDCFFLVEPRGLARKERSPVLPKNMSPAIWEEEGGHSWDLWRWALLQVRHMSSCNR